MLIASLLLGLPLWLTIPAYFALGLLWAVLYLPRAITRMGVDYHLWSIRELQYRSFEQVLAHKTLWVEGRLVMLHPQDFLDARDAQVARGRFSFRRVVVGFMLDIAFWPARVLHKLVTELLLELWKALWRRVFRLLRALWDSVIVPACRWVYRRVLVLYRHITHVYQAIIQRANREAINDMAILAAGKEKK